MARHDSRYEAVTRRALLQRLAAIGAIAAVPGALLAACNTKDEALVQGALATRSPLGASGAALAPTSASPTDLAQTDTPEPTVTTEPTPSPSGTEMVVNFTYAATGSSQGPVRNPYVAVWVEDANGQLVSTIALWFLQTRKGMRWLSDLRRWYMVDGSADAVGQVSSATRTPGQYSVVWDGTTVGGTQAETGDYFVCVEAAREHGPYSLIRSPFTLDHTEYAASLTPDGELTDASIEIRAAEQVV